MFQEVVHKSVSKVLKSLILIALFFFFFLVEWQHLEHWKRKISMSWFLKYLIITEVVKKKSLLTITY